MEWARRTMRILCVEDDVELADVISASLRLRGHVIDMVHDGETADAAHFSENYSLVILDLSLPKIDGLEVLRRIRDRDRQTPVLIMTARASIADRVAGLDRGADDYLAKPFALEELEARVRALLRRNTAAGENTLTLGDVSLNLEGRRVDICGNKLNLPRRELGVLELLMIEAGKVVSKERLHEHVFGLDDEVGVNAIEIYIHRLRKRLSMANISIKTYRGLGYMIDEP